jgi:putative FmdB family regulatory protein
VPIYEYQCQACEERLEIIQSFSDPPPTTCPECGGDLKKLLSAPAFQFKGSGWYVTDYARQGNGSKDGDSKSADSAKGSDSGVSKEGAKAASGSDKGSEKSDKKAAKSAAS